MKSRNIKVQQRFARTNRRAVVTVEMALLMSLAFLVMLGTIEMARFQLLVHAAENAAYEAARVAIIPGASASAAENTALSYLAIYKTCNPSVTITPNVINEATETVRVRVAVPVNGNSWVIPTFGKNKVIQGEAILRTERSRT